MPQFAAYKYAGRSEDILFLVPIQSTRFARTAGCVVMPLLRLQYRPPLDQPLTPQVTVQDQTVYADPLDIATVPASRLGDALEILSESDQDRIVRAVDEMISRA